MCFRLLQILILLSVLGAAIITPAFETDQYNLPPAPLADIGDEVAEYTEQNIVLAITKLNAEISKLRSCLDNGNERKCGSARDIQDRLAYLRSDEAAAREVFNRLGYGLIAFTKAGSWMNSHEFRGQPARYKTSFRRSIFVYLPTDYFTISPTVNIYGHLLGTDKIAHFFQQGYAYHRIYSKAKAKGMSATDAVRKAVEWGQMTERTYYGTLVGGVFSNADLAANYAGMRFYKGLVEPVRIGPLDRQPVLRLTNGRWEIVPGANGRSSLLRPFITDNFNEALNPSLYIPGLRSSIRRIVKKQSCPAWRAAFPDTDASDFEKRTAALELWNGEDYGHRPSEKLITIANTCFEVSSYFPVSSLTSSGAS